MDRLSRLGRLPTSAWLALICTGCPAGRADPPPPAESLEIASAAPGALGALAAGTEAAPNVGTLRRAQPQPDDPFGLGDPQPTVPAPEGGDEAEDEPDAGATPKDAGLPKRPIEEVPL